MTASERAKVAAALDYVEKANQRIVTFLASGCQTTGVLTDTQSQCMRARKMLRDALNLEKA